MLDFLRELEFLTNMVYFNFIYMSIVYDILKRIKQCINKLQRNAGKSFRIAEI